LAIILDNKVYSAPVIQEKISGGAARITGSLPLKPPAIWPSSCGPALCRPPSTTYEERTVGPSLGTDSIRKGFIAMLIAELTSFFLWQFIIKAPSDRRFRLLLNIVLIAGGLAAFRRHCTAGIAGIILTIGMAVDANVSNSSAFAKNWPSAKRARRVDAGFNRPP
jgi:preprotein translocase subunit SecD